MKKGHLFAWRCGRTCIHRVMQKETSIWSAMQEGKRMCRVMQKEHAFTERCRKDLYLQSNAKGTCNLQGDAEGTCICRMCDSERCRGTAHWRDKIQPLHIRRSPSPFTLPGKPHKSQCTLISWVSYRKARRKPLRKMKRSHVMQKNK